MFGKIIYNTELIIRLLKFALRNHECQFDSGFFYDTCFICDKIRLKK